MRVLGMALASVLLVAACGSDEEIVYVDHDEHASGHGAYTPLARSASPRVHPDGNHHPADPVQIGPSHEHEDAYTPMAASNRPLVHAGGTRHQTTPAVFSHERTAGPDSHAPWPVAAPGHAGSTGAAPSTAAVASAKPGAASGPAAQPAASPTVAARLNLGPGLGASVAASGGGSALALTGDDADDRLVTVTGRIESIVGQTVKVSTPAGPAHIKLGERSRVDIDALGTPDDLKPGRFVGAVQTPGGPATSVRLYATGPSMPRPGIVPVVGSRQGQVTAFGSVVTLQFGGLLLNTGSATTTVTLPSGVEILKPAPADASALAVGTQIIATGTMADDDVLTAQTIRITGQAAPAR